MKRRSGSNNGVKRPTRSVISSYRQRSGGNDNSSVISSTTNGVSSPPTTTNTDGITSTQETSNNNNLNSGSGHSRTSTQAYSHHHHPPSNISVVTTSQMSCNNSTVVVDDLDLFSLHSTNSNDYQNMDDDDDDDYYNNNQDQNYQSENDSESYVSYTSKQSKYKKNYGSPNTNTGIPSSSSSYSNYIHVWMRYIMSIINSIVVTIQQQIRRPNTLLPLSNHSHNHNQSSSSQQINPNGKYPSSSYFTFSDRKQNQHHNREQTILMIKMLGMLLIVICTFIWTKSVHVDHLHAIQYHKEQQIQQQKSLPSYRKLRVLDYYTPTLYDPTDEMKQQFLSFEHQQELLYHTSSYKASSSNHNKKFGINNDDIHHEYPILHIIKTRFMQEQNDLLYLGEARLALFKIFCLSTMIEQTTQNFIWLIKTDPNLNQKLLQQLIDSIIIPNTNNNNNNKFRGNIYIIGSNVNYRLLDNNKTSVTTPGAWRDGVEPFELTKTNIYTGNRTILEWYMSLQSKLPLLETRIDADDGLHTSFIHTIQQKAYQQFYYTNTINTIAKQTQEQQQQKEPQINPTVKWMYWCSRRHIEWHWTDTNYFSLGIDTTTNGNDDDNGSSRISSEALSKMLETYGVIQGIQHTALCITPGITVGYNVGTSEVSVPVYSHDQLYNKIKHPIDDNEKHMNDCGINNPSDCLQFIETFIFEAIRSRTPTSAGMLRVEPSYDELQHQHKWWVTYAFWNMLHDSFGYGITRTSLSYMNSYISYHLLDIVTDNIRGQCTTGHSCKDTAKESLQKLLHQAAIQKQSHKQQVQVHSNITL